MSGACLRRARHHPVGGPSRSRRPVRRPRPRRVRARRPGARICYGMQTWPPAGGPSSPGRARVRLRRGARRGHSTLLRDIEDGVNATARPARRVDEPRRPRRRAAARLQDDRLDGGRSNAGMRTRRGVSTRCSSTPRSRTPARARAFTSASCMASAAATRAGMPATSSRTRSRACARRWAWQGAARVVGRRGLLGRRGAAAQGDRRSADLRVRGPRPAASHEGDQVMAVFARNLACGSSAWTPPSASSRRSRRRGPEAKRKIIGRLFIEVFDEEAAKLEGVEFLAQARSIRT